MVTTILVLYLCWRIPFDLGLDWWTPPKELKAFELFADIWFGVDILLNFRTGHVHDGHLVMNSKAIASHYFEFWFWIDVIATIPFELFGTYSVVFDLTCVFDLMCVFDLTCVFESVS